MLNAVRRIDIVCLGDINVDWLQQNDVKTAQFTQFTKKWNLLQSVSKPTRVTNTSETLIDLLMHNINGFTFCGPISLSISDHFPIAICNSHLQKSL